MITMGAGVWAAGTQDEQGLTQFEEQGLQSKENS